MDILIGITGGGIVGLIITHFYYKKTKKEDDKQLKEMKEEFESLDRKISKIDLSNVSEKEKKEIRAVSNELKKWVSDLNKKPGEIECKINKKLLEVDRKANEKSDLIREYVNYVIDIIDDIINALSDRNLNWEKPILPANLFNYENEINIYLNKEVFLLLSISSNTTDTLYINLIKPDEEGFSKFNGPKITFAISYSKDVKLDIMTNDEFKFIGDLFSIEKKDYKNIFSSIIKELFEYLLLKKN